MQETVLQSARFEPKVKQYWLVFWILLSVATVVLIPLLPVVIILVLIFSQRILDAMSAELFERKLVVKRGILVKIEKSIPLEKITDVGLTQGPLMRFFDIYRLDFETAGQSGAGALVSMLGIVDAKVFRESILTQKDVVQGTTVKPDAPEDTLSDILSTLKNIEALLSIRHEK
ncbi:MAG: PH domain-containing protein [Pseudomonadota bacterium]